jgi:hypothetical protein
MRAALIAAFAEPVPWSLRGAAPAVAAVGGGLSGEPSRVGAEGPCQEGPYVARWQSVLPLWCFGGLLQELGSGLVEHAPHVAALAYVLGQMWLVCSGYAPLAFQGAFWRM